MVLKQSKTRTVQVHAQNEEFAKLRVLVNGLTEAIDAVSRVLERGSFSLK